MPDPATKRSYSRDEVCRLLGLREATIEQWESHGFVPRAETYAFRDLVALKALRELKHKRIPPQRICLILKSLRNKLTHIVDPLSELKIFSDGRRLAVQVDGAKMEPISGQLLLDFDREELRRLLQFPGKRADDTLAQAVASRLLESAKWFDRGVELEQTGAPPDHIIAAYRKALEHDPNSAAPHVNLGTVFFHQKNWREAEAHYRAAIQINPGYALAHFNLGNLQDEMNDTAAALASYLRALEIQPTYADAHYNVALIYQGKGDTMRAVRHWRSYLKLDPSGYWASIARRELSRLRQETIVGGAH